MYTMSGLRERRRYSAPQVVAQRLPIHLVLDIDNTLLDTVDMDKLTALGIDQENVMPPSIVNLDLRCYTFFRPHMMEFLDWAFTTCKTVSIFTAAKGTYVTWILKHLGERKWFGVYTYEQCRVDVTTLQTVKPLKTFWNRSICIRHGMDNTNTIHIDDLVHNFEENQLNGISIPAYHMNNDGVKDTELIKIRKQILHKYYALQRIYKTNKL